MSDEQSQPKPRRRLHTEQVFLALVFTVGYCCELAFVLVYPIPQASERIADMMLGALTTILVMVVGYFYNTNASSTKKTELIAKAGPVDTQ